MQMFLYKMMNGVANMARVLPMDDGDQSGTKTEGSGSWEWVDNLIGNLKPILYALMLIVAAAGAVYAIILGVNLAKAEDTSKRDEAKKHLITVLIAVGVTIALVLFFTELLPTIIKAFTTSSTNNQGGSWTPSKPN